MNRSAVIDVEPFTAGNLEFVRIESQLMEDRGVNVCYIVAVFNRMKPDFVGCAMNDATYTSTIQPIFGTPGMLGSKGGKCSYCHFPGGLTPNLANPFDPTLGAVGVASMNGAPLKIIEPGNPDMSFLVTKVSPAAFPKTKGAPMPYNPERLSAEQVELFKQWIKEGAKNN